MGIKLLYKFNLNKLAKKLAVNYNFIIAFYFLHFTVMHMAKDNGQFNEYITKRELKRSFHIIDKHIARYFPEPVRINISKFGDTFRDAYPLFRCRKRHAK